MQGSDARAAMTHLQSDDLILEEFINFTAEVSFLVARAHDGTLATWAPSLNQHRNGILHSTEAPAPETIITPAQKKIGSEAPVPSPKILISGAYWRWKCLSPMMVSFCLMKSPPAA